MPEMECTATGLDSELNIAELHAASCDRAPRLSPPSLTIEASLQGSRKTNPDLIDESVFAK